MAERQMATSMAEVREDHKLRYEFAINELIKRGRTGHIIDAGCGVGYGSFMLSHAVDKVTAIDVSSEAHELFCQHWQRPNIRYHNADLTTFQCVEPIDAVVCFEFIEHIEDYGKALEQFAGWSDLLIISTPNEEVRPHLQEPVNPFHFRHFRPSELSDALQKHGMHIDSWHCQKSGAKPEILDGTAGKFIIAVAEQVQVPLSVSEERS
jgi:SAM-dependent methyltransferase